MCINTLFKIITNILKSPGEEKFRKLKKEKIQTKILAYPNAIQFLKIAGFTFQSDEYIECTHNDEDILNECKTAIENFLE